MNRLQERYIEIGWNPIPVPARSKNPNRRNWELEQTKLEDIPRLWNNGQNTGLITGQTSNWLIDGDLDCKEVLAIAGRFYEPTLTSGREGAPDSHWWFYSEGFGYEAFTDLDKSKILEVSGDGGHQTLVEPSIHPCGEKIQWSRSGLDPVRVEARTLLEQSRKLAAAGLIARHLPEIRDDQKNTGGGRHDYALSLAGFLLRRGLSEDDVLLILKAAWDAYGFGGNRSAEREAHRDLEGIVRDTAYALKNSEPATGGKTLEGLVPGLPRKLSAYFGWKSSTEDSEASEEPQDCGPDPETLSKEAYPLCAELSVLEDLTAEFADTLKRSGVAGERKQIRLLYLALCSRLLPMPVSVAIKGPSSGGKSHLLERVVEGFPEDATYSLTSMSEKALIYLDEDMRHKHLIIYEASGMEGDMQTYLIRSLLSEGCIRYQTAESTSKGVKPRLLEMEGPTGLMVTTTASRMHPENETRLLSIYVTDTREQTREIFFSLADEDRAPVSMDAWKALQTWIAGRPTEVSVPYGKQLAEKIPPIATRLRRDFGSVLRLIRSHALLHQAGREIDDSGRIVASLEDYRVVRELVADIVSEGVGATVRQTVRETVAAVAAITEDKEYASLKAISEKLSLDRSTAQRRVQAAKDGGYLVNDEDTRGKPAKWIIGDPLPSDVVILPTVKDLADEGSDDDDPPPGGEGCAGVQPHPGGDTPPTGDDVEGGVRCATDPDSGPETPSGESPIDKGNDISTNSYGCASSRARGRGVKDTAHLHTPPEKPIDKGNDLHTPPLHTPLHTPSAHPGCGRPEDEDAAGPPEDSVDLDSENVGELWEQRQKDIDLALDDDGGFDV